MNITLELLQAVCPGTHVATLDHFVAPLNQTAEYYDITQTPARVSGFIAQLAHESGGFNAIKENLNYSSQGLRNTFGKYFTSDELADHYARNPMMIANRVYANRMGNGDEASGDGYKYCGRGLVQLTGKNNYTTFAAALSMNIDECVAYMETPDGACASAGWFWDQNQLNTYCDSGDFTGLTKRINGGTNGLDDRLHRYEIALKMLQG